MLKYAYQRRLVAVKDQSSQPARLSKLPKSGYALHERYTESQVSESDKSKGRAIMSSGEYSSHDKGKGHANPQDETEELPAPPSDADGEGDFEDWSGF